MKLPPLTDEELKPFLEEGVWVAKLATINPDGTIRITPMTYALDDGDIIFSTWRNSDAVRNTRLTGAASVLIDKADQPYAGVHYTGHAEVLGGDITAEQYGRWFQRYIGSYDQAVESYKFLVGLGTGTERSFASGRSKPSPGTSQKFRARHRRPIADQTEASPRPRFEVRMSAVDLTFRSTSFRSRLRAHLKRTAYRRQPVLRGSRATLAKPAAFPLTLVETPMPVQHAERRL